MEAVRQIWGDDKLNHLEHRVDDGFARMDQQFAKMDQQFAKMDQRFEKFEERFDRIDERFEKVDERLERFDERFEKMDERFLGQDARHAKGEIQLGVVEARLKNIEKLQFLFAGSAVMLLATLVGNQLS
jgi:archaellum component FlaC